MACAEGDPARLTAVANACGYADHRAFARAYRARYGMNPSAVR